MGARIKIVLTSDALAKYPEGGGHWSAYLQYVTALLSLGHDLFWIELLTTRGDDNIDNRLISTFLRRFSNLGMSGRCAIIMREKGNYRASLESRRLYGISDRKLREVMDSADLLWNFHCSMFEPLLSEFRGRKVLIDLDPGQLQVGTFREDIDSHDVFFSVGTKLRDADCLSPTLGYTWHPFLPPVDLDTWPFPPPAPTDSPLTSVTQWNWPEYFHWADQLLTDSKRDAYLRFIDLPSLCRARFKLAVNLEDTDGTGDRSSLTNAGWEVVHPHLVTPDPQRYRNFIAGSLGEFGCAKQIYSGLRTGWFSDRSAAYLASGRPVILEDTGFPDHLETGEGLLAFVDVPSAAAAVEDLLSRYSAHAKRARELADAHFSARRILSAMIDLCA